MAESPTSVKEETLNVQSTAASVVSEGRHSTRRPNPSDVSLSQADAASSPAIVRARGFLWGTTADSVRAFFSACSVEGVHFVDQLHGECYVELAGEGDLGRALEKHALRVGSSYRKRLIEVFCATFEEMKHALAYSLDREERERKRLLRGGRKGNRGRGSKPGRRERRGRSWSWSRSRSRSRSGGRRSRSRSSRSRSRGRRCRSRSWSRERRSSKTKRRRRRSSSASDSESSRSRSPLSCSYDTPSPASRREEVESVAGQESGATGGLRVVAGAARY